MIDAFPLRFVKFLVCTAATLLLLAVAASAQTVISSNTSSGSASVGPGSGLGSLNWTVEDDLITCTETDPPQFYPSYQQWTYSSFVYVDGSGVSHNMSGGAIYYFSNGDSPPCPGSYSATSTLTGDGYTIFFAPSGDSGGTASLQPIPMYVNPKYIIMAVVYAPPGSQSNVTYSQNTLVGNSTSLSGSFTNQTSQTVSVSAGFNITGVASGSVTGNSSTTWSEEADTSASVSLNRSTTQSDEVRGPTSSLGVNHDYDVIWLWLNPLVNFNVGPGQNTLVWTGYSYDTHDQFDMDVYPVYVGYLNGHFTIPSDVAHVLSRSWATNQTWPSGQGPGLTSADFATILAADPFSNPSYSIPAGSSTSPDGRFTVTDNQNISYTPPPPGGNPITETYVESYQTTQTQGQGAKYTFQQGFGTDTSFSTGVILKLSVDIKTQNTLTWNNQWSTTRTNTTGQSASLSVTGPAASDNYTGPTEFVVYQDNIYGTFMFYPVQ